MSQTFIIQQLFSDLTNINVIESSGAGNSLKYEAVKGEEKVIVKISFEPIINTANNQIVESQVYEHVLQYLHKHTPHLPKYYGTKKTTFDKSVKFDISKWREEDRECWNIEKVQIMVIEHVGTESLRQVDKKVYDNPQIVFQVLYTIACFERVGLKHNDLHYGNIMIQRLEEPVELSYEINGMVVSFTTNLVVKIIDYDRSCIYHEKVERNFYLDFLQKGEPVYQYNGINSGFDTFKFLSMYTYESGDLKIWLSFVCPKIRHSIYCQDLLPPTVNPREFVPNTVEVLESLVDNFPEKFRVTSIGSKDKVYCLPEDTSVKPIVDKTKFLVSRCLRASVLKKHAPMYKELLSLGYNWKLHHCKLFSEAKETFEIPECDDSALYKACVWITNPTNQGEEPNDYVNVIRGIYRPVLFIPQKQSCNDILPEQKVETVHVPESIPEQKAVEKVLFSLPEKYHNSTSWHKSYSEEECESTRKYLVEIRDKFFPEQKQCLNLLDNKYYESKATARDCSLQFFLALKTEETEKRRSKIVYLLFAVLSRTLHMFSDDQNYLLVLENKLLDLKETNHIDFSPLLEFDVPILPTIEEVIPSHLI